MDNMAYKPQHPQPGYPPQYDYQYGPQQMQQSSNNVTVVTTGGFQPAVVTVPVNERDWTVPAVLATLFCFLPTGICAIIAAVHARNQFISGDIEGGRSSTAIARALTLTSIGLGVVFIGILIALYIWVWSVATSLDY